MSSTLLRVACAQAKCRVLESVLQGAYSRSVYGGEGRVVMRGLMLVYVGLLSPSDLWAVREARRHILRADQYSISTRELSNRISSLGVTSE